MSQVSFNGWLTFPPEMTQTVFSFLSHESLIDASYVCRLWKGLTADFGKSLVTRANLLVGENESWQKVYRAYLDTIFFLVLDVSNSMDFNLVTDVDDESIETPFLSIAKEKAKDICKHLEVPMSNGKVFAVRLGNTCNSNQVGTVQELESYYSTISEDRGDTNFTALNVNINQIANNFFVESNPLNKVNIKLPKIELNLFSDFNISGIDFRKFSKFETYFRFFNIGKETKPNFIEKALENIGTPMEIEIEETKEGLKRKRIIQTTFGCSTHVDLEEPKRIYKKARF